MIKQAIIIFSLAVMAALSFNVMLAPDAHASAACDNKGKILTLKPWYYGLTEGTPPKCTIKSFGSTDVEQKKFINRIILTVVEDLLQIAGYVTVIFIIMGGFTYMTSGGAPDKAAKGMKTITNAAIGLVVAMASIGLINFIAGYLNL